MSALQNDAPALDPPTGAREVAKKSSDRPRGARNSNSKTTRCGQTRLRDLQQGSWAGAYEEFGFDSG
jgi:hypothetical protein